jgi:peptidoglycan/xylan/chitin deacetylase (PgdA/CDA1 family)
MRWFARNGLRVLMYHKVSVNGGDGLTVTCDQLENQLRWLDREGFPFVRASHVLAEARGESTLPRNCVLVTFDDAYLSTFELAFPILRRLGIPAVVFAPTAFVGRTSAWDAAPQTLMQGQQLRELEEAGWEIGLHSHRHENYGELDAEQIAADLRMATETLGRICATPLPALAYPYGRRPVGADAKSQLHRVLATGGVHIAFRIGNRVNRLPLKDVYDLNRIGPRGDRDLEFFQRQIRWGRWF